jgi:flagellar assembly protein FliH
LPDQAFAFEELHAVARPRPGNARAQAESIVLAAQAEADRIRDEARETGYREGLEVGRAEALAALEPAAAALADALAAVRSREGELADAIEAEACRFALAAAERIVAGTIEAQPERVLDIVRGALRAMVERERVTIQLNPADLELVRGAIGELAATGGTGHIDVQEERRVARGSAVLRTTVGEIDARVEAKLERLRAAIGA